MSFFKMIIPNYNSEKYIKKCIDSVLNQTFKDFDLVIADDMSEDNSVEMIKEYKDKRIHLIINDRKRYNGGSRNVGIEYDTGSKYTLFMDCDDWLSDENCFQAIYDKIIEENYPDCVSMGYVYYDGNETEVRYDRNTPEKLVKNINVACWTKCIKSELVVNFPENTLMEDVSQHIEQCDCLKTVVNLDKCICVWNRANRDSISQKPNKKRKSSEWRQLADVVDLDLEHDYCIKEQEKRVQEYLDLLLSGRHVWKELSR